MVQEIRDMILKHKIIVIMRTVETEVLLPTVRALYEGGIRFAEVTFDQSGRYSFQYTGNQIEKLKEIYGKTMRIGAGTVLNEEQVKIAYDAGAEYIISPNTDRDVIEKTRSLDLVSIPGAMTPTEIQNAHLYGADFVKVFPAGVMGEGYFRDVLAPLSHVKLIATGGIEAENLASYLQAGAVGAGVGSGIVKKKLLAEGKYDEITMLAKHFCDIAGEAQT